LRDPPFVLWQMFRVTEGVTRLELELFRRGFAQARVAMIESFDEPLAAVLRLMHLPPIPPAL
jgi:hypothetical protein